MVFDVYSAAPRFWPGIEPSALDSLPLIYRSKTQHVCHVSIVHRLREEVKAACNV